VQPTESTLPGIFHFRASGRKMHRDSRCEGESTRSVRVQPAAATHWSEDTLGLLPEKQSPGASRRCAASKAASRVNFPLPTYSALREKIVSRINEDS